MKLQFLCVAMALAVPATANEQQVLILDCPVSKVSPLFDLANFPEGAAMIRMERYRFAIPLAGGIGRASTPRANDIVSKVVVANTQFQIAFENKLVVIDRMNAEFELSMQGGQGPIGGGLCTKLEERKF